jgi:hypothetical protein
MSKNIRKMNTTTTRLTGYASYCVFAGVRDIHYKASTICISSPSLEGHPSVSWCFGAEMIC